MKKVTIHVRDGISFVRKDEMSDEDKELFSLFNMLAACPGFPDEESFTFYASDYERYLARKESYVKKYGGTCEFRKNLKEYYGFLPYA